MSYPILFSSNEYYHVPAIAGIAIAGLAIAGDATDVRNPFKSQGLGTLSDCISCIVTEERNGMYELEMQYPISGIHFEDIQQRYYIFAKPNYLDDPQAFRIYKITKPLNGICTIYAQHLSYDLSGKEIPGNLSAEGVSLAVDLLNQYADGFTITTQRSGSTEFKTDVPASVRSWFGGKEGSLIDLYGGEWKYDMYNCRLMNARGADRGVTVRYGKNLISLEQEEACSNMYTAVRAFYKLSDSDDVYVSDLISTGIQLETSKIFILDCSSDFDEIPTTAQLNERATAYINTNNLSTPHINLTLDFVQMQYLDRVDLCDTVTVIFEQLGVNAKAKCIKTEWDVLKDRYQSITLGDAKSSFAETIEGVSQVVVNNAVKQQTNELQKAIEHATEMITGNLGGYVVLHDSDGDGYPDEILIMDEPNIEDAVKIWRWNKSGLGYSSTGYAGTFGLAITADGRIVADFITTGYLSANRIQGGTLTLGGTDNNYGVLQVLDASGNVIGSWDRSGASITGDLRIHSQGVNALVGQLRDAYDHYVSGFKLYPDYISSTDGSGAQFTDNSYIYFPIAQNTTNTSRVEIKNYRASESQETTPLVSFNEYSDGSTDHFVIEHTNSYFAMHIGSGATAGGYNTTGVTKRLYVSDPLILMGSTSMYDERSDASVGSGIAIGDVGTTSSPIRQVCIRDGNTRYLRIRDNNARLYASSTVYFTLQTNSFFVTCDNNVKMQLYSGGFNAYASSNTYMAFQSSGSLRLAFNGTLYEVQKTSVSSQRYKHDIAEIDGERDPHKLLNLKVRQFVYNDDAPMQYRDMKGQTIPGFIAEDVAGVYPSAVIHNDDGEVESWDERRIIPPMLSLIQEQQKKIEELTARIERLEKLLEV